MKHRRTRQLSATWNVLSAASDHPSAETLLARVRRLLPNVSLGTIYRNLEKLHEQGQIRVIRLAGGVARYDAFVGPHDHFVCESCGAVHDLPPADVAVDVAKLEADGFVVRSQSVAVYGLCRSCARRGTATPEPPAPHRSAGRSEGTPPLRSGHDGSATRCPPASPEDRLDLRRSGFHTSRDGRSKSS